MPWVLFAIGIWAALLAFNSVFPWYWPGPMSVVSFFAGWLYTELPLHHIVAQLALGTAFAAAGGLSAWPGWVGLGGIGISLLVLCLQLRSGLRARRVVEEAIEAGLGSSYAEAIPSHLSETFEERTRWRDVVRFLPIRPREVERIRDLVYCRHGEKEMRLDAYRHREMAPGAPVFLFVHGGAWVIGNKEQQGFPTIFQLARHGWLCFTMNYRLSPRATFPEHLEDVKRAIAWVHENAAEYGGRNDFVVLCGGSAGAHLAALAALTPGDPVLERGFEEGADTSVQACVPYYGVYDFSFREVPYRHRGFRRFLERYVMKRKLKDHPEAYAAASPILRIGDAPPPFLVVHGASDTLAPVEGARRFTEKLRTNGNLVAYAELPGTQHAFEVFPSPRSTQVVHGVERFCAWAFGRHLGGRC